MQLPRKFVGFWLAALLLFHTTQSQGSCFHILNDLGVPFERVSWAEADSPLQQRIKDLAARVLLGDGDADSELFRVLMGMIYPITLRRTVVPHGVSDPHSALEIAVNTIHAVFTKILRERTTDLPIPYIFGMARNQWRKYREASPRELPQITMDDLETQLESDDRTDSPRRNGGLQTFAALEVHDVYFEMGELETAVRSAAATLPPRRRAIFEGRFLQGKSLKALGEEWKISIDVVGKLARKSRRQVIEYLNQKHPGLVQEIESETPADRSTLVNLPRTEKIVARGVEYARDNRFQPNPTFIMPLLLQGKSFPEIAAEMARTQPDLTSEAGLWQSYLALRRKLESDRAFFRYLLRP